MGWWNWYTRSHAEGRLLSMRNTSILCGVWDAAAPEISSLLLQVQILLPLLFVLYFLIRTARCSPFLNVTNTIMKTYSPHHLDQAMFNLTEAHRHLKAAARCISKGIAKGMLPKKHGRDVIQSITTMKRAARNIAEII